MKHMKKMMFISIIVVFILSLSGCKPWTIVKNERTEDDDSIQIYFASDDFDANTFTADIWDNKLIEYYNGKKVNVVTLIDSLKSNEAEAGELYAIGENDIGSSWQFVIDGKGKVLNVNTESRAGVMSLDLEPYDGIEDIIIQVGPVIKGSSTRDTLEFIKLDDFENQVEFASLSKAFNLLIVERVFADLDVNILADQEIEFLGTFTYKSIDEILVAPVNLKSLEGE